MSWARAALLVARVWGARRVATAFVGVAGLSLLWQGRIAVPMRRDVAETIWPLAPCLLAFTVPAVAARAWTDEERVAPRSAVLRRLCFVGAVCAGAATLCLGLSAVHPFTVLARNTAFLVGLGLGGAVLLPSSARWVLPVMVPVTMWLLGARSAGLDPAGWAVLLHEADSQVALRVAAAFFLAGAGLYVGRPQPLLA